MEPLNEKMKRVSKSVRMSHAERLSVRQKLISYMHLHATRGQKGVFQRREIQTSTFFSMSRFLFVRATPAFLIVALLGGSSLSYAAEGALPGDLLYPVKVSFNEEVRGAFALSGEEGLSWAARKVERRLEEAVELASRGELTEVHQATLSAAFETQAEDVALALERDDSGLALELSSRLEAVLAEHERLLAEFSSTGDRRGEDQEGRSIGRLIEEKIERIATIRSRAEGAIALSPAAGERHTLSINATLFVSEEASDATVTDESSLKGGEEGEATSTATSSQVVPAPFPGEDARRAAAVRMEKAAQMKLAEARTLIEKGATKLDAAVLADSSARHDAAKALFDEGAGALQNGEFIVAFQKLKESLFAAEKLVVLLKTYRRLKSDVRSRSVEIRLEREDRRGEGASTSQSEENDGEVSKEDISKPLREVREGAGELDFSGESVGH